MLKITDLVSGVRRLVRLLGLPRRRRVTGDAGVAALARAHQHHSPCTEKIHGCDMTGGCL